MFYVCAALYFISRPFISTYSLKKGFPPLLYFFFFLMVLDAIQFKLRHNLHRIIESIELNKPLNPQSKLKNPCNICNKNVTKAQKYLLCNACDKRCHIKCDCTSGDLYEFIINANESKWICLICTLKFNHENFPFTLCDNHELENIHISDTMSVLDYLPGIKNHRGNSKLSLLFKYF